MSSGPSNECPPTTSRAGGAHDVVPAAQHLAQRDRAELPRADRHTTFSAVSGRPPIA